MLHNAFERSFVSLFTLTINNLNRLVQDRGYTLQEYWLRFSVSNFPNSHFRNQDIVISSICPFEVITKTLNIKVCSNPENEVAKQYGH
uniref:Uncharacterized protein n=1 Tax=Gouania willdenowi TaxID=441366 RepID=A0A8C5HM03_GOUWI